MIAIKCQGSNCVIDNILGWAARIQSTPLTFGGSQFLIQRCHISMYIAMYIDISTMHCTPFEGSQLLPRVPHTKVMKQASHLTRHNTTLCAGTFLSSSAPRLSLSASPSSWLVSPLGRSTKPMSQIPSPYVITVSLPSRSKQHSTKVILITSFSFLPKVHIT